ncbi:cytochrome C-type biogenesis protein [Klebsiella pneumoniae]|nr:cytochrome C-type biogenesis protein [Klebsiella pneumoniae]
MNLLKYYQQYRDKWWALPLVLPALLLPVARWANTYTMLNGHMVFLGNDSNLLIVFYVQIMPDDFVMQLHRF